MPMPIWYVPTFAMLLRVRDGICRLSESQLASAVFARFGFD